MKTKGALEVILFADGKFVGNLMFTSPNITIGRDKANMVKLDDPKVSSNHAVLHFTGRSILLEDLGSTNGVLVRGERVENKLIEPTDELEIGKYRLRFVIHKMEDEPGEKLTKNEPTLVHRIGTPTPGDITEPGGPRKVAAAVEAKKSDSLDSIEVALSTLQVTPTPAPAKVPTPRSKPLDPDEAPTRALGDSFDVGDEDTKVQAPQVKQESTMRVPVPGQMPNMPGVRQPSAEDDARRKEAAREAARRREEAEREEARREEARREEAARREIAAREEQARREIAAREEQAKREREAAREEAMRREAAARDEQAKREQARRDLAVQEATAQIPGKEAPRRKTNPLGSLGTADEPRKRAPSEGQVAAVPKRVTGKSQPVAHTATLAYPTPGEALAAKQAAGAQAGVRAPSHHDEDDDEDLDDVDFEPPFSLFDRLTRDKLDEDQPHDAELNVEAILFRDGRVLSIKYLGVRDKYRMPGERKGAVLATRESPRLLSLSPGAGTEPRIFRGDQLTESDLPDGASVNLSPGMSAILRISAREKLYLHFVAAEHVPPPPKMTFKPTRNDVTLFGTSFGVHVLAFVAITISAAIKPTEAADLNEGRYAKVEMKDLELEPPPPPKEEPKPEPEPEPVPTPEAKPSPVPPPKVKQPRIKMAGPKVPPSQASAGPPPPSAAANKLLSALGSSLPQNSKSPTAAIALTNIDAVSATRSGGGFKVSGTIGKLPGDQLRLAAAGSGTGRIDTKTAAELVKNGLVGKVNSVGGGGTGKVRGLVAAPPARTVQVQGELDRGEIQRVVNQHLREVQGCYERKLIKDPTLAGKIIYEWVIKPTGDVGVVRVKFSDVRNTEVSTCIQSSIQTWHFPQPRGGPVTVTYPFVFSTIGI